MRSKSDQSHHADEHRVPVENSRLCAELKTCPQWFKKVTGLIEWNTSNHVAKRSAKKNRQQDARTAEQDIKKALPDRILDVTAHLNSDPAQHQQPQHDHERQIKTTEARGIKLWKGEIECAAGSDQPHFIAIPIRRDHAQHSRALVFIARDDHVQNAHAEIESIEHHEHRNRRGDEPEPNRCH